MTVKEEVNVEIKDMIYTIREQQVMLDYDLAKLFGYKVKQLNQQVKRHGEAFVEEVVFQLTKDEIDVVRSLEVTAPTNLMAGNTGGRRTLPYAFTLQGIEVLGTVLRAENIQQIMHSIRSEFSNQQQNSMVVMSKNTDNIMSLIYTIRGIQVMLDNDLAQLFQVDTGRLNEAAKRNEKRFPSMFRFQLTKEEYTNLVSQFAISSLEIMQHGGRRIMPFVYSEQGIAMLSAVLNSDIAIQMSIKIMQTFVEMRHYLNDNRRLMDENAIVNFSLAVGNVQSNNKENSEKLIEHAESIEKHNEILNEHTIMISKLDCGISEVNSKINALMDNFIDESKQKEWVFVDGQKFEADEAYIHIYKQAKQTIFVVDDYVSIKTLSHLKHKNNNVQVILFSDNKAKGEKLTSIEIDDFNSQYPFLCLYPTHKLAHDRLIVLDYGTNDELIYLCGASSKDAGNRFCTILKVYDPINFHPVIDNLRNT